MSEHSNEVKSGTHELDLHQPAIQNSLKRYWRMNVIIMTGLLLVWAFVGLGCGVLWADWLNQYKLPGTAFPLGFWFAQQGSIIVFVGLILAYCLRLNILDANHQKELEKLQNTGRNE